MGFPVLIVMLVGVIFTDSMYFTSSHFPSFVRLSRTAFQASADIIIGSEVYVLRLRCMSRVIGSMNEIIIFHQDKASDIFSFPRLSFLQNENFIHFSIIKYETS